MFYGIREQVVEDFFDFIRVGPYPCFPRVGAKGDFDALALCNVDEIVENGLQYGDNFHVLHAQTQCSVLQLTEIHDLIGQLPQPLGVPCDGVE